MLRNEKVSIVGSGLVGKSWAMIFASAGYRVRLNRDFNGGGRIRP